MNLGMLLPNTPSSNSSPFHSNSSSTSKLNCPTHSIATSSTSKSSISNSPPPNPFFDNIRQLNERLSLSGSLQHLTPIDFPKLSNPSRDLPRLPHFLARLLQDSPHGRAQRLAHEFHDLEMAEQLRLQDVMRWETSRGYSMVPTQLDSSKEASTPSSTHPPQIDHQQSDHDVNYHPFSISAGVELGYKNRYKNIWPYEHARVRLRGASRRSGTDYVNASTINFKSDGAPPGLDLSEWREKKYIATQGPLTSTFEDFWSVVAEEDVGLIIMITRRHEAGREKCADYVRNGQYGETVVSVNHHLDQNAEIESDGDEERDQMTGFFGFTEAQFNNHDDQNQNQNSSSSNGDSNNNQCNTKNRQKGGILVKTIHLSRATRPDLPPRKIAHIQYRGWPDFDVPPAAEEVLDLISRSHQALEETVKQNDQAIDEYIKNSSNTKSYDRSEIEAIVGRGAGPVLVHCSAGVGRTGSFILLDVMLDVLKTQYLSTSNLHINDIGATTLSEPISKNADPFETCFHSNPDLSTITGPPPHTVKSSTLLPKYLNSQLCDCMSDVAPVWHKFPIMPLVDEMREQRMSMVANYRQYVFLHEVLMKFMIKELKIPTSSTPTTPSNDSTSRLEGKGEESLASDNLDNTAHVLIKLSPCPQSIKK